MQKAKKVSAGKGGKILQLGRSQQNLHILSLCHFHSEGFHVFILT